MDKHKKIIQKIWRESCKSLTDPWGNSIEGTPNDYEKFMPDLFYYLLEEDLVEEFLTDAKWEGVDFLPLPLDICREGVREEQEAFDEENEEE